MKITSFFNLSHLHKHNRKVALVLSETVRAYLVVLFAPFLLLAPNLLRGKVLFWGTPALQFVPWWWQAWLSLRQGALPLWNPLNGMGAPLLANYQLAFFYPPNWLLLLFAAAGGAENGPAAIAWGYSLLAALHLAWAGLGMARLIKALDFPWLGQVVGGLAFALSGYTVARLGFFSMTWVVAWMPGVVLFAYRMAGEASDTARPRRSMALSIGLAISLAMQLLAGHAQLTWYTILLAGLWVTVVAWQGGGFRQVLRSWAGLVAAGALAAGLAAVQLLPTFEFLQHSQRADAFGYEEAMTYSFWPWRFLTLFSPDFFGNPARGDFWGYASYWEDHLYPGMVPLLLALASLWLLARGFRRARRSTRWVLTGLLWLLVVLAFALALGKNTPLFPFLYHYVPTFDMFQAPARYLVWVAFAIPLLAAVGIERWRCPAGRGLYWFRLGTAGAFAVTFGALLAWQLMGDIRLTFIRATALAGIWALGFGLLTLAIPLMEKRGRKTLWQAAVIGWTLLDLLVTGWSLNPGADASFFSGKSAASARVMAAAQGQRVYLSPLEEYDLKFKRFLRFKDFAPLEDWRGMREVLLPNLNLLDGISSANNFDPLVPDVYARWMDHIATLDRTTQASWLAYMGVGAVEHIDGSQEAGVRFDPVGGTRRWHWFDCSRAAADTEQAWQQMEAELDAPRHADRPVILTGAGALPAGGECGGGEPASIRLVAERPDRLVLSVEASSAGWLVTADTWYPGWVARLDGEATPLYQADFLFRAVAVPEGNHVIVLLYRPAGFYFGGLFSILVLLFVMILLFIRGR